MKLPAPLLLLLACSHAASADSWPQWRHDAQRSGSTADALPTALDEQWVLSLPTPRPAWPVSQPWLRFDASYCPVASDGRLIVPSMVDDSVTAYDVQTGEIQWRFFAEGPVRLAPVIDGGRVYFGSDDGYLYCLDVEDGRLAWRHRVALDARRVLGNGRLISPWPIRGGPVLFDGSIHCTAGVWPFMGIVATAIDAQTGQPRWINSGEGSNFTIQPHSSPAFAGFVPRGHLAATSEGLIAPGGRTEPGVYDLTTGRLRHFRFGGKGTGSYRVTAGDDWFFALGKLRAIREGNTITETDLDLHDGQTAYVLRSDELVAWKLAGEPLLRSRSLWKCRLPESPGSLMLKAGDRFYTGKAGQVAAVEVVAEEDRGEIVWRASIEGLPWAMLASDERLFVVTMEGRIHCFGADGGTPLRNEGRGEQRVSDAWVSQDSNHPTATAVMLGIPPVAEAMRIVDDCAMHWIGVDADEKAVDGFRAAMFNAGLHGRRTEAITADPFGSTLPPYLAQRVLCRDEPSWQDASVDLEARLAAVFRLLRPYGGKARVPLDAETTRRLAERAGLKGYAVEPAENGGAWLSRPEALPGSADWTHQYADAAATGISEDNRVKAPLGLLWFGGPSNDAVLPRHGHGPSPQVAGGRLVIEGPDMLRAIDVYTGRLLWQRSLPELGTFHNITGHQPGAGEIGGNYVTLPDAVYVVQGEKILRLDPDTGETTRQWIHATVMGTPGGTPLRNEGRGPRNTPNPADGSWGGLAAWGDLLIVTSMPVELIDEKPPAGQSKADWFRPVRHGSSSLRLVVLDRHSGEKLWHRDAEYGFRHNAIIAAAGRIFVIDGLSAAKRQKLVRRGFSQADYQPRLLSLDARNGRVLWSTGENVIGTFLNYSVRHDVLLSAGSAARDRASDESRQGMVAFRGSDGKVLWKDLERAHSGPCLLHDQKIITQGPAYSLLTGEPLTRTHPLTDEPIPWEFFRNYGCNTAIGSRHLLTFRSAAAGYCDLLRDGGTGNLGGFKSGCTSNLIPAGGVLSAPEYTRTCLCTYQNQTSLAMRHDPDAEMWTFNPVGWSGKPVRRVGINFGAPGDRRTDAGTLWLDTPSAGSPSPELPTTIEPVASTSLRYFRHHGLRMVRTKDARALPWVASSGVEGVGRVVLTLAREGNPSRKYTVRLHFAETEGAAVGQRVFDIHVQGQRVGEAFDTVGRSGGFVPDVFEVSDVTVEGELVIELTPTADSKLSPLLSGVEVEAEGW